MDVFIHLQHWQDLSSDVCCQLCCVSQIQGGYSDVTANTLYDVLHDPYYRKSWDPYILEGFDICRISPNSDIGYYASECLSFLYVYYR